MGGATLDDNSSGASWTVSMPHAALWVVQHWIAKQIAALNQVSMPHAALWVVQLG